MSSPSLTLIQPHLSYPLPSPFLTFPFLRPLVYSKNWFLPLSLNPKGRHPALTAIASPKFPPLLLPKTSRLALHKEAYYSLSLSPQPTPEITAPFSLATLFLVSYPPPLSFFVRYIFPSPIFSPLFRHFFTNSYRQTQLSPFCDPFLLFLSKAENISLFPLTNFSPGEIAPFPFCLIAWYP